MTIGSGIAFEEMIVALELKAVSNESHQHILQIITNDKPDIMNDTRFDCFWESYYCLSGSFGYNTK